MVHQSKCSSTTTDMSMDGISTFTTVFSIFGKNLSEYISKKLEMEFDENIGWCNSHQTGHWDP